MNNLFTPTNSSWKHSSGKGFNGGSMHTNAVVLPDCIDTSEPYDALTYHRYDHVDGKVTIIINFSPKVSKFGDDGHTFYLDHTGGWRSFDRRGIETSFTYGGSYSSYNEGTPIDTVLEKEYDRAMQRVNEVKSFITLAETGFKVSPARLEEMRNNLKNDIACHLRPNGFGTGYTITTTKPRYFGSAVKGSKELNTILGTEVYLQRTDND